jgi:peptide/nickel transport system substrate-binding protein
MNQKTLRYYYWVVIEFAKKHVRLILLSFLLSIIGIISIISFSPYLISYTTTKKETIGNIGITEPENIPDPILSKISSGLVFINEKGEIVPVLAEKWERSGDGKTYKFYLKKNLYWNSGKAFTAKSIAYKFKDVEVKPVGDYELVFTLKKPLPIFPTYLTSPVIKYPFDGVAGLYKADRFKMEYGNVKELYLTPNKPGLPFLVYKFYDNETKMVNAYKLGEINQMVVSKKSVADFFTTWKNTQVQKSVDYSRLLTLFFNMNNELLKQKDHRKAIVNAIPRQKMDDQGLEAEGPIPPISWAYNPNLKKASYDPDLAAKVLKKANEGSSSAALQLDTYYDYLDVAEDIQKSLEEAGLKVKVNTLSFNQPSSFDMLLAYWKVPLDPDQYYFWHSTQKQGNIINYNNVKIDKLLEDGRSTTSVSERKDIYNDFQRTLVDDTPAFFMFYPYIYTIKRK